VFLENGENYEIDVLLLGTGFKCNLSNILDDKILKIINYDYGSKYGPVNLAYDVFHPSIKNLAFVGIHFFLIFFTYELQAKLALEYFLSPKNILSKNLIYSDNKPIDFGDYTSMLAQVLDILPDLKKIETEDKELHDNIISGPLLPQIFILNSENKLKAMEYIKIVNRELMSSK
jgi:hypothetical protein